MGVKLLTDTNTYTGIANAIRTKTGKSGNLSPSQMITEINSIVVKKPTLCGGYDVVVSLGNQLKVTVPLRELKVQIGQGEVEVAELKRFAGGKAIEGLNSHISGSYTVDRMKDINGTTHSTTIRNGGTGQDYFSNFLPTWCPFDGIMPVATYETNAYDENDYAIVGVGTQSYSATKTGNNILTLVVTVSNSTSTDIKYNCVKFKKNCCWYGRNTEYGEFQMLLYGYYLDNEVTVPANGVSTISFTFTF